MKTLFFVLLVALTNTVFANLYECRDGEDTPYLIKEPNHTVDFIKTPPSSSPLAIEPQIHKSDVRPYLIYYVVDSPEPYMKLTVKYEIAALKNACERSKNVNFIAFLNSLYTEKNEFIVCKDGKYGNFNFSKYTKLDSELKIKHQFIGKGDHTGIELGPMDYLVSYRPHLNAAFKKFPLAHPDFLYDLLNLATSEKDLFPRLEWMPFLNLKSHGSKTTVLSGLLDCQIQAKTLSQNESLKKIYSSEELEFLNSADFSSDFEKANSLLERSGLGDSVAVGGSSLGATHLGATHLSSGARASLGSTHLSTTVSGLGASNGLGTDFSFGLVHVGLTAVLSHLFNSDNKNILGFAMLEACDTDRDFDFFNVHTENVLGTYSAKNSLWYRNLNWSAILEQANGSTSKLYSLLIDYTAKIDNIIVK